MFRISLPALAAVALFSLLSACGESLTPEELLARAQTSLEAGDFNAAGIDAKAALQQAPRNAQGRMLLGDVAMARAYYQEAVDEYERAISFASDPEIITKYAVALVESGQYRRLLDEALEGMFVELQNNGVVLAALANAEGGVGNGQEASTLIEQAMQYTVDEPFVRLVEARLLGGIQGDVELARERAEALVTDHPEYAEAFSTLGSIASLQQDHEAAVAAFLQAATLNPLRIRDRLSYITAAFSLGDFEAVRNETNALNKIIPDNPILNFFQGRLALAEGDIDAGLLELDQVLADIPNHPGALYFAGLANLEKGNLATAEQQLASFLTQNPGHVETRLALGRLYLQNSEPERAQTMASNILTDNPNNTAAARILAAALGLQGAYAESADVYAQLAAASDEVDVATQVQYGSALVRSGDEAGIAELEKARDLDPANAQARSLLVAAFLAKGDVAAARAEVESYLAAAPDVATPHVLLGQVELWEGNDDAASLAFKEALEIDPTSPPALRGSAGLALREGNVDAAAQVFEDALEEAPDSLDSLMSLAAVQERQGDSAAMVGTLERAIDVDPNALAPRIVLARYRLREQSYGEAVALLTEVRDQYPASPDLHELLAGGFLGLGETSSAVSSARRLLDLRPDSARALRMLAVAEQADGQFPGAEEHIKRALELEPTDRQSRRTLVELYIIQKKYDELAEVMDSFPDEVKAERDVKLARGRLELLRADVDEALVLLREAHEMQADTRSTFLLTSALLRDDQNTEAEAVATAWLDENPNDGVVLQQYSTYLLAHGRDKLGAEYLERLLKVAPDDTVTLNNLAWAYRSANPERALELVDRALEKAPDNMSVIDTKSMILFASGEFEDALKENDKALKTAPGFPQLLFHRGQILAELGRIDEAIRVLTRVQRANFAERSQAELLLAELESR